MLRESRRKKGYTQKNLARKIGVSQGYYSKLEDTHIENIDNHNVTIRIILKISKELDICPVKTFLFFVGDPYWSKYNCHIC
jgi:transcriptional regulator with XRE-family HTH domain